MKQFNLNAVKRTEFTKAAVKALRRNGMVPCILYGNKQENISFSVVEKDLLGLIYTPNSFIVNLNVEGESHLCILYAAQYHPVNDNPLHLDFLAVNEQDPITISVPVVVSGNSVGVRAGGKLFVQARKLNVKAQMANLPDQIDVDITNLQLGKSIVAGDLKYDNVQIVSPKNTIICMVRSSRGAVAETTESAS